MAFFRAAIGGGGVGNIPEFGDSPDAIWSSNGSNLSANATATVTVTQKPKYVVVIMFSYNAKDGLVGYYDVEKNEAYRFGYWSSTRQDGIWSNYDLYITSVTDSSVTVKQVYSSSQSMRTWVNCYYGSSGGGSSDVQVATGTVSLTTTSQKITTGFRPKYISCSKTTTALQYFVYDETVSLSKYKTTATASSSGYADLGTGSVRLVSVENDGFYALGAGTTYTGTYRYVAIG